MQSPKDIQAIKDICSGRKIDLPHEAGLYAFWWLADRKTLLDSNRSVVLKGPGGNLVDARYEDWWPKDLVFPCLYVGKTTNIRRRFSLHLKRGYAERLHQAPLKAIKPNLVPHRANFAGVSSTYFPKSNIR